MPQTLTPPVVLTTSGTGSRLGPLTKYTNKSLIKVGDKYAICHIIELYPENTEFIITLGYFGAHVKDFLELAYPTRTFTFVYITPYEGDGSSLGYSILQAKSHLQRPFIFHCCDTILKTPIHIPTDSINAMVVMKSEDYHTYASVSCEQDQIRSIYPKGYKENTYIYLGVSYIYDYSCFWNHLEDLYTKDQHNQSLSDIHALMRLVETQCVRPIVYNESNAYDTGNLKSYENACKAFGSDYYVLEKYNESLCFLKDRVIKFVNESDINKKRVQRGKDLYPLVPKILDSRPNFMCMELIQGQILSECKEYGHIARLLEWAQTHLWSQTREDPVYIDVCKRFYKEKTLERISKLSWLQYGDCYIVNGIPIGPITQLVSQIKFESLYTTNFTKFHGDFILDNILKTDNQNQPYCLLDWRHEFDKEMTYGDRLYDLAKLRHNMIFNHANITQDLFTVEEDTTTVTVDLKCNYILIKQLEDLNSFLKVQHIDLRQVELLTGIIWLNMAPLYEGKLSKFLFYFGKLNVYLAIQAMDCARP